MTTTPVSAGSWRHAGVLGRVSTAWALLRLAGPYLLFGLARHAVPLPRLARWAWRRPTSGQPRNVMAERIAIARVVKLRRLTLADRGDCVAGSLVLYRVLSRSGADPKLVMGLRRGTATIEGHAWVTVDGMVAGEEPERVSPFSVVLMLGSEGRIETPSVGGPAPTARA